MATKDDVVTGAIYVDGDRISAITRAGEPAPAGFENVPTIDSGGTVYPGLIELHNHLSYNILPLWQVPQAYTNRAQWQDAAHHPGPPTGPSAPLPTPP